MFWYSVEILKDFSDGKKCMHNYPKHKNVNCYYSISKLLTLLRPMEFSVQFDTVNSGWSFVYIDESYVIISKRYYFFL